MKLSQTNFFVRSKYRAEAGTNLDLLPKFGQCPWRVNGSVCWSFRSDWRTGIFIHLQLATSGSRIANTKAIFKSSQE